MGGTLITSGKEGMKVLNTMEKQSELKKTLQQGDTKARDPEQVYPRQRNTQLQNVIETDITLEKNVQHLAMYSKFVSQDRSTFEQLEYFLQQQ